VLVQTRRILHFPLPLTASPFLIRVTVTRRSFLPFDQSKVSSKISLHHTVMVSPLRPLRNILVMSFSEAPTTPPLPSPSLTSIFLRLCHAFMYEFFIGPSVKTPCLGSRLGMNLVRWQLHSFSFRLRPLPPPRSNLLRDSSPLLSEGQYGL